MNRLTTNDANHIFASLNLFYAENNEVMIRGGGPEPDYADTTLVELVRRIARTHDLNIAAENPESLGDELYDAMFDGVDTVEGVVALLHAAAVQAAEMRGRLASIEDILGDSYDLDRLQELVQADQEGRCAVLPCKVGDTVYRVVTPTPGPPLLSEMKITTMKQAASLVNLVGKHMLVSYYLTREEAEAALKEAEG